MSRRKSWTDDLGGRHWTRGEDDFQIGQRAAEKNAKIRAGLDRVDESLTVEAWSAVFLRDYINSRVRVPGQKKRRGTMTQGNAAMYRQKLDGYILPAIGFARLVEIRPAHLQRLLNAQAGMSESHCSKVRIVLQALFAQAYEERLIPFDPSENLQLPATAPPGTRRSLTDVERAVLLRVAVRHPAGLWVRFLLATGLRMGETAPLLVRDLYLDAPTPFVHVGWDIESGTNTTVSPPKTEAGTRNVPIPSGILADLRALAAKKGQDDYLFPAANGTAMASMSSLSKRWDSFARAMDLEMGAEHTPHGHIYDPSDILPNGRPKYPDPEDPSRPRNGHRLSPDVTPHCLRHTYCTDLQRSGVPLNVARYLMGHAHISTTAEIYTHTGDEEMALAVKLMDEWEERKRPVQVV